MLRFHNLCRLKLAPTKECDELGLSKGVRLRLGGGMGRHLCIAQVGIWRETWCVIVMLMNEWVSI